MLQKQRLKAIIFLLCCSMIMQACMLSPLAGEGFDVISSSGKRIQAEVPENYSYIRAKKQVLKYCERRGSAMQSLQMSKNENQTWRVQGICLY